MAPAAGAGLVELLKAAAAAAAAGRVPPTPLLKALLSRGLGLGVVAGACGVKLPQVLAVARARRAAALSALSLELEAAGLAVAAAYGLLLRLPFSAYGETLALLAQTALLLALVYRYQRAPALRRLAALLALVLWAAALATGAVGVAGVTRAYDLNNALLLASRLPQIARLARTRDAAQLSLLTYGLNVLGSAARIFTAVQEDAGVAMLRGAALSTALNAVIAGQILAYGRGGGRPRGVRGAARKGRKAA
jgi:hypothetical protein